MYKTSSSKETGATIVEQHRTWGGSMAPNHHTHAPTLDCQRLRRGPDCSSGVDGLPGPVSILYSGGSGGKKVRAAATTLALHPDLQYSDSRYDTTPPIRSEQLKES